MRLGTFVGRGREQVGVRTPSGLVPMTAINRRLGRRFPHEMQALIASGAMEEFRHWYASGADTAIAALAREAVPLERVVWAPLYRHPGKIWCIGLNYAAHAAALSETSPTDCPASFLKPDTTLIGDGEPIRIPTRSARTTAEAELAIVIGRRCKDVIRADWLSVVAGFTSAIDVTAEDILRRNPRYLTLSKSFDTFCSFGPLLVTPDEIDSVADLTVATVLNGQVVSANQVSRMTFPPDELVAFHASVMTLLPGDVILTGTPGAAPIRDRDRVTCRISGFDPLNNPVIDLKRTPS